MSRYLDTRKQCVFDTSRSIETWGGTQKFEDHAVAEYLHLSSKGNFWLEIIYGFEQVGEPNHSNVIVILGDGQKARAVSINHKSAAIWLEANNIPFPDSIKSLEGTIVE